MTRRTRTPVATLARVRDTADDARPDAQARSRESRYSPTRSTVAAAWVATRASSCAGSTGVDDVELVVVAPPAALAVLDSIGLRRGRDGRGSRPRPDRACALGALRSRAAGSAASTSCTGPSTCSRAPSPDGAHGARRHRDHGRPQRVRPRRSGYCCRASTAACSPGDRAARVSETTKRRIVRARSPARGRRRSSCPTRSPPTSLTVEPKPLPGLDGRRVRAGRRRPVTAQERLVAPRRLGAARRGRLRGSRSSSSGPKVWRSADVMQPARGHGAGRDRAVGPSRRRRRAPLLLRAGTGRARAVDRGGLRAPGRRRRWRSAPR